MAQLTFSQSERPSYLGPILGALAVLIAAAVGAWFYFPHHTADLTVIHTVAVPTHVEIETGSKEIGHQTEAQDNLYVLITLRIDDKLHDPLFINDMTATLTTPDDATVTTSAVEKNDLNNIYIAFPQVKPLATAPLLRETTIPTGGSSEGMVMLHFPITHDVWNNRKSATLTVTFYHQGPVTVTIPKS
jgi:hypothetical protein